MDGVAFRAKVDVILVTVKSIAGRPVWRPDRGGNSHRINTPLILDGVIRTDVSLEANAPTFAVAQSVTLLLLVDGRAVERIETLSASPHSNWSDKRVPRRLRGLTFPLGSNHLHTWDANWWTTPAENLPTVELGAFDSDPTSVIRFALTRWKIESTLHPPPHEPRFDL